MAVLRHIFLAAILIVGVIGSAVAETVLHRGNGTEPNTLDPHQAAGTWEHYIIADMYGSDRESG